MKNKNGFTLVELLVVIAILAILVLLAMPNILNMFNGAKKKLFVTEAAQIAKSAYTEYVKKALSGNKINKISSKDDTKLNMDGGTSDYYIELDDNGNIIALEVSNDSFCLQLSNNGEKINYNEITDEDVKEGSCDPNDSLSVATLNRDKLYDFISNIPEGVTEIIFPEDKRPDNSVTITDLSSSSDGSILGWIEDNKMYIANSTPDTYVKLPKDSSYMFSDGNGWDISSNYCNISKINVTNVNTSSVENMSNMFFGTGRRVNNFEIVGLDEWNTSKVTDMSSMFAYDSDNAPDNWNIGDLSSWDVSNVETMASMFRYAGKYNKEWSVGNISNWVTSKVTDMSEMFYGVNSSYFINETVNFSLDLSGWDVSNIETMASMFDEAGCHATTFNLDLSKWYKNNTMTKLTNTSYMFAGAGQDSTTWDVKGLENINTSKVTNMSFMFEFICQECDEFSLDIGNWDVSNVETMYSMFGHAGSNSNNFKLDLSNWNTSKVNSMGSMFAYAGSNSDSFELNLSNWNTSHVNSMSDMFYNTGHNRGKFLILIPATNGNSSSPISNSPENMYGSKVTVYANSPSTDLKFSFSE